MVVSMVVLLVVNSGGYDGKCKLMTGYEGCLRLITVESGEE